MEREPQRDVEPPYRCLIDRYDRLVRAFHAYPSQELLERIEAQAFRLDEALLQPGYFELGRILATQGASLTLLHGAHHPAEFLLPHKHADWGDLDAEDRRLNNQALRYGGRLLSAYQTRSEAKLWVITEWDRSVTTLLLPEEY